MRAKAKRRIREPEKDKTNIDDDQDDVIDAQEIVNDDKYEVDNDLEYDKDQKDVDDDQKDVYEDRRMSTTRTNRKLMKICYFTYFFDPKFSIDRHSLYCKSTGTMHVFHSFHDII